MDSDLPREILPEIMTYWGGHMLGLTCRTLNARMTDEYLSTFARKISVDFEEAYYADGQRKTYTVAHHELPNGTFHGRAETIWCDITYSRGRLIGGTKVIYDRDIYVSYHGNWLVMEEITNIADDWWVCLDCGTHQIDIDFYHGTIDGDARVNNFTLPGKFPICYDMTDGRKWLDIIIRESSTHFGDDNVGRGKLELDISADHIRAWPDVKSSHHDH